MSSSVLKDSAKGLKWSFVGNITVKGVQFVLSLIMARLLTPTDYGLVGMHGVFLAVTQIFIDSGFSSALIKKLDRTEEDYCTVFYFNMVIAIVGYLVLFAIAPWVAVFFHQELICPILRVQAIALIINSLMAVQVTRLTIEINFRALAVRSIASSILSGVFGVILAYIGWGVWAIVAQGLFGSVFNMFFLCVYCRWIPRKRFSWKSFHSMFGYGSKLLASSLINTVYSNLQTIIIGRFYTPKDLGVYNRGISIPGLPIWNINGVLQNVLFPILTRFQDDDEMLIYYYRKYIALVSLCNIFVGMIIAALGKPIIIFLLTDKWAESIIYLQIFCFSLMFDHLNIINHTLLLAKGRSDLFLKLELIKKPIFLAVLLASIPFGVVGICISSIINTQIAIGINTYYTGKFFDYGYWHQLRDFYPFAFIAVIACAPAYLLTFTALPSIVVIILGCAIAPSLYWLLLRKNEYMQEALQIAKTQLPWNKQP